MSGKKAFTLIELLVVIAIIGILASIGIVVMLSARTKATDTQTKNNARELSSVIEQYKAENNDAYPVCGGACFVAGGAVIAQGDSDDSNGDQAIPNVSSYLSAKELSAVFLHDGIDAKYVTDDQGLGYAQAWSLRSQNEETVGVNNGVYEIVGGVVTPPDATYALTDMNVVITDTTRAFLTYGPQ